MLPGMSGKSKRVSGGNLQQGECAWQKAANWYNGRLKKRLPLNNSHIDNLRIIGSKKTDSPA